MRKVKNLFLVTCLTLLFSNYTTPKKNSLTSITNIVEKTNVIFSANLLGNGKKVGSVKISTKAKTKLSVTFQTKKGWSLKSTKLFIGDFEDITLNDNGCPNLKEVRTQENHNLGVTKYSYEIPLSKLKKGDCIAVVSKAIVTKGSETITAWSEGESFSCKKATYSKFCKSNLKNKRAKALKRSKISN